jgi:hypothetical protein
MLSWGDQFLAENSSTILGLSRYLGNTSNDVHDLVAPESKRLRKQSGHYGIRTDGSDTAPATLAAGKRARIYTKRKRKSYSPTRLDD